MRERIRDKDTELNPTEEIERQIKRDKAVRSKKHNVGIEVINYK